MASMANEPIKLVEVAVKTLLEKDHALLLGDVNERAITAKLASYLSPLFPDWDVDCEYNRNLVEVKKLVWKQPEIADPVIPDIIIHKRNTEKNFIVIEVKKSRKQSRGNDIKKLAAFKEQLGYKHALFLTLNTEELTFRAKYKWV